MTAATAAHDLVRWRELARTPFQTPQWYRAAGLLDTVEVLSEPTGGLVATWPGDEGDHYYHSPLHLLTGEHEQRFLAELAGPRAAVRPAGRPRAVLTTSPYGYRGGALLPSRGNAAELAGRLVDTAQRQGAALVLSHYLFDGQDDAWLDALVHAGGVATVLGAQCTLDIRWSSLAEYYQELGSSRRSIRQRHAQWRRLGQAVEAYRALVTGTDLDAVVRLLAEHASRHGDARPPLGLFRTAARGEPDLPRVLHLVRGAAGEVRSALVTLVQDGVLYPKFFGSREPKIDYLPLVYDELIEYAATHGYRRIDYGGSAHQAKMYRGARLRYALGVLISPRAGPADPVIALALALGDRKLAYFRDLAVQWHLGRRPPDAPRHLEEQRWQSS